RARHREPRGGAESRRRPEEAQEAPREEGPGARLRALGRADLRAPAHLGTGAPGLALPGQPRDALERPVSDRGERLPSAEAAHPRQPRVAREEAPPRPLGPVVVPGPRRG